MAALYHDLLAALRSREERLIRRRLPDPAADEGLADFSTNDYLSLASSPVLRSRFLSKLANAPAILGSGGSRLLVNGPAHAALEARLATFFDAPAALLFNSGFDANVGFFSCVPQPGDALVFDEHIHASVHDGVRASRIAPALRRPFSHNSVQALREELVRLLREQPALRTGASSVFVAVESLYSMDGTIAPLTEMVEAVEGLLPAGNGYVVVDEAHTTGVYGPQGRGLVALLGLERRVLARLHTFGKALAGTGAILLTTPLVRDYLLNYARSLIYTTSLGYANIISVDCSFDLLEDGTGAKVCRARTDLSTYCVAQLRLHLRTIPLSILALPPHLASPPPSSSQSPYRTFPTPVVPLLTPYPRPLSAHLRSRGLNARPIVWPTVPKGRERVRVCLHAGNTREEVDRLVGATVKWAEAWMRENGTAEMKHVPGVFAKARYRAITSLLCRIAAS
ncbi:PLP-dependent transferase [Laetiporus sulphureus 93-53]|uniref:PLP-dependent transferase n=1 Tax=Laetiporus sulphureus 93-53 TaxID=1314785 RepID=A0A165CBZ6_9APHY|nr:PLP-dependent transferase [Laetiporus sulphureus 93-53]KZT02537.1 PLP-dependent transferase [Laetiporus sulphureus 93-53]